MDLVIGIGNRLRRDDGIGPALVESFGERAGAEFRVVHQLTPDLAPRVGEADRVLFVDAAIDEAETCLRPVEGDASRGIGHTLAPAGLLHLVTTLYGVTPPAWVLAVPGSDFEIGETLSRDASERLPEARRRIEAWLDAGTVLTRT